MNRNTKYLFLFICSPGLYIRPNFLYPVRPTLKSECHCYTIVVALLEGANRSSLDPNQDVGQANLLIRPKVEQAVFLPVALEYLKNQKPKSMKL